MYKRKIYRQLLSRLKEQRKFIQVLAGPRQTGKTTLVHQVLDGLTIPTHYVSADQPSLQNEIWLEQQWEVARLLIKNSQNRSAILVLDEIQKLPNWSNTIKSLWDEDTMNKIALKVVLLGSAPLLIQRGLTESLAGRFEIIPVPHWSFSEMKDAFGFSLDEYIFFGGYPGAAEFIHDHQRWKSYINDALIETTISRDILLMNRIDKPALLRRLFFLGCEYSGQILSYTKMLGQLHDAGNTTTLAHYLQLLSGAGMVTEIKKYAGERVRRRASSPKLNVLNTGLMTAVSNFDYYSAKKDSVFWGRLVESAVGAHLINNATQNNLEIYYWRHINKEVDFVIKQNQSLVAMEVKSGLTGSSIVGLESFSKLFNPSKILLIGNQGITIENFFSKPIDFWL
ncbi:MAG: ATP-binding protein [Candidatus Marinimicrobia bacterium]|nr:ATP-binding protein [Candidatus Neomarinimicrobiota bacterium]